MTALWEDLRVSRGMTEQMGRRRERTASGDKPIGWKVAFGTPAVMQRLETTGPLIGFLMARGVLASGATVSISGWTNPRAEPEIAVYMGRDLRAGADRATAAQAIAGVGPAIELVDTEYQPEVGTVENVLATNIFHRHVMPGAKDTSRAGCVLEGLTAHILKNNAQLVPAAAPAATSGELIDIVRHVADMTSAFGEGLRAGEVIITGLLVPPIAVAPGDEILFRLEPIGAVSVRFADKTNS